LIRFFALSKGHAHSEQDQREDKRYRFHHDINWLIVVWIIKTFNQTKGESPRVNASKPQHF
jgi:hypothetical protein